MPQPPDEHGHLWFLSPRAEAPEGITSIRVSLPAFFATVGRVGPDAGLLLLTLRALRARSQFRALRVSDLTWILVAPRGEVLGWLERLSRARLVVYDRQGTKEPIVIEVAADLPNPKMWPVTGRIVPFPAHDIPTHWFVQVLPRLGRRTFLIYLALLSREEGPQERTAVFPRWIADVLGIRFTLVVHYHLGRLMRFGLVQRTRSGFGLIVLDPPPLTHWGRLRLRLLQWGYLPLPWRRISVASLVIAIAMLFLHYLATHRINVLPPPGIPNGERSHEVRLAEFLPRS